MCGEFGEVTVIIGLVINFLAFVSPLLTLRDTLTYEDRNQQRIENFSIWQPILQRVQTTGKGAKSKKTKRFKTLYTFVQFSILNVCQIAN